MIPYISQIPDPYGTAVLVVLLIIAFVVAFKIMKMVFQTILVSVLSGVFYVALAVMFNYPFSLNNVLMFAFLGSTLYMAYSFLASAYSAAHSLLSIPYTMIKYLLKPFKVMWREVEEKRKLQKIRDEVKKDFAPKKPSRKVEREEEEETDNDTREVVLDKVRSKDEEE